MILKKEGEWRDISATRTDPSLTASAFDSGFRNWHVRFIAHACVQQVCKNVVDELSDLRREKGEAANSASHRRWHHVFSRRRIDHPRTYCQSLQYIKTQLAYVWVSSTAWPLSDEIYLYTKYTYIAWLWPKSSDIYLRQGGCVIVVVCLFVSLTVSNIAQELPNGFAWNFQGRLGMGQWTKD